VEFDNFLKNPKKGVQCRQKRFTIVPKGARKKVGNFKKWQSIPENRAVWAILIRKVKLIFRQTIEVPNHRLSQWGASISCRGGMERARPPLPNSRETSFVLTATLCKIKGMDVAAKWEAETCRGGHPLKRHTDYRRQ